MVESKFLELCSILDTLLGPNGCPWDQEQTLDTLRTHLLEESCELIDAVHENDVKGMKEEVGDLFLVMVFFAKIATKEGHFTLDEALEAINSKLIRRHPHIFGDGLTQGPTLSTADQVLAQWEQIKKAEKPERESVLDAVAKSLPALEFAYKMISRMKKTNFSPPHEDIVDTAEEKFGRELFDLVKRAEEQSIHPELALRKVCKQKEKAFRAWESSQNS